MTGPTTRKMVVNALNSGAKAWMADFEDATAPTWFNVVDGQLNLYDAIRGQVDFTDERGKRYAVGAETPTIMVRPRGWHLDEAHLVLDGRPVPVQLVGRVGSEAQLLAVAAQLEAHDPWPLVRAPQHA